MRHPLVGPFLAASLHLLLALPAHAQKAAPRSPEVRAAATEAAGTESALVTLPAGTFLSLETTETLDSDRAKKGQTIGLRVRADVRVQGRVLIRTGALAYGYVVETGNNYSYNEPAFIVVTADQVQTTDGSFVKLHGKPETITGEFTRATVRIEPMYVLTANIMNQEQVLLEGGK